MTHRLSSSLGTFLLASAAAVLVGSSLKRRSRYSYAGRHVLITGGSRGLGLALARQLAKQSARISLLARDESELQRAKNEIAELGGQAFTAVADVAQQESVAAAIDTCTQHFGPVDVLINCAGTIIVGPVAWMNRDDFAQAMNTNFWGTVHTCLALAPAMRQRQSGKIINIVSLGGKISVPHLVPYAASKFAAAGFSEGLTAEMARDGISVTTVYPSLMRTGSAGHAWFKGQAKKEYAWFSMASSLPLLAVKAEDAAAEILAAAARGEALCFITRSAQWLAHVHALLPELSMKSLSLMNRLLPAADGGHADAQQGQYCESSLTRSFVTKPLRQAAAQNNELQAL